MRREDLRDGCGLHKVEEVLKGLWPGLAHTQMSSCTLMHDESEKIQHDGLTVSVERRVCIAALVPVRVPAVTCLTRSTHSVGGLGVSYGAYLSPPPLLYPLISVIHYVKFPVHIHPTF